MLIGCTESTWASINVDPHPLGFHTTLKLLPTHGIMLRHVLLRSSKPYLIMEYRLAKVHPSASTQPPSQHTLWVRQQVLDRALYTAAAATQRRDVPIKVKEAHVVQLA